MLLIVPLLAVIGLVACKPKVNPNEPGSKLVEERCYRCHQTGVSTRGRTVAEWDLAVTKMIGKGAVLNPQEKAVLVDYLARTYPR